MRKIQILIMIALVAVVIWYFSQDTKPTRKPTKRFITSPKPSFLPHSLPQKPFSLPSNSAINSPSALELKPPYPPCPETSPEPAHPDEQYRLQTLSLLETWQAQFANLAQKSKIIQVISLLQAENKPRDEYLQAAWGLRAMEGFDLLDKLLKEWVNLPVSSRPTNQSTDYG